MHILILKHQRILHHSSRYDLSIGPSPKLSMLLLWNEPDHDSLRVLASQIPYFSVMIQLCSLKRNYTLTQGSSHYGVNGLMPHPGAHVRMRVRTLNTDYLLVRESSNP